MKRKGRFGPKLTRQVSHRNNNTQKSAQNSQRKLRRMPTSSKGNKKQKSDNQLLKKSQKIELLRSQNSDILNKKKMDRKKNKKIKNQEVIIPRSEAVKKPTLIISKEEFNVLDAKQSERFLSKITYEEEEDKMEDSVDIQNSSRESSEEKAQSLSFSSYSSNQKEQLSQEKKVHRLSQDQSVKFMPYKHQVQSNNPIETSNPQQSFTKNPIANSPDSLTKLKLLQDELKKKEQQQKLKLIINNSIRKKKSKMKKLHHHKRYQKQQTIKYKKGNNNESTKIKSKKYFKRPTLKQSVTQQIPVFDDQNQTSYNKIEEKIQYLSQKQLIFDYQQSIKHQNMTYNKQNFTGQERSTNKIKPKKGKPENKMYQKQRILNPIQKIVKKNNQYTIPPKAIKYYQPVSQTPNQHPKIFYFNPAKLEQKNGINKFKLDSLMKSGQRQKPSNPNYMANYRGQNNKTNARKRKIQKTRFTVNKKSRSMDKLKLRQENAQIQYQNQSFFVQPPQQQKQEMQLKSQNLNQSFDQNRQDLSSTHTYFPKLHGQKHPSYMRNQQNPNLNNRFVVKADKKNYRKKQVMKQKYFQQQLESGKQIIQQFYPQAPPRQNMYPQHSQQRQNQQEACQTNEVNPNVVEFKVNINFEYKGNIPNNQKMQRQPHNTNQQRYHQQI